MPEVKLQNVNEAINTLENLAASFARGEVSRDLAMGLTYIINTMGGLYRLRLEADLDRRLAAIEAKVLSLPERTES